ncbi:hypothetical protein FA743_14455 [Paracoccus gahaiensis]|uniref:Fumarylacetoacetase-like C-terminal domain-containing protein n=1 Tax=Paracoccus gahaiensis TaxID=1706839 RepID=A0A4V5MV26_9RHOB|nr:fumarylacetoacetate hydrolase family protein [Paracoccus gahaiensis]TJZ90598.1 hypothetical protein FA743_14455 [Paracoccus gahaiensis]
MTQPFLDTARLLATARKAHRPIVSGSIVTVPTDFDQAYALQNAMITHDGGAGGWKVLAGGADVPQTSPLPRDRFYADGARIACPLAYLAEAEVAVELSADLPARDTPWPPAEIAARIRNVRPAIELCSSALSDRDQAVPMLRLGDTQNNAAVITGAAVAVEGLPDLSALVIGLQVDDRQDSVATGASWDQILTTLAWLAGHAAARGLPLTAGDIVITGARIKLPMTGDARRVSADLGPLGTVSVNLG